METPSLGPLVPRLLESFLFFLELSGVEPGAGASLSVSLLLPKLDVSGHSRRVHHIPSLGQFLQHM